MKFFSCRANPEQCFMFLFLSDICYNLKIFVTQTIKHGGFLNG
ncbi:hypothetical protein OMAG_002318 [Candidatus Omnitrophus magneticus]|uniref:Uncharacterized protein n=1 Tax=Candidatus Omnitrophus magneticus TaxID=1609969 RepID=A0A0F0CQW1_9BACT|nr:hypothetical protein OMAG_002318 [Candidatus Omnitrophus magneticus]